MKSKKKLIDARKEKKRKITIKSKMAEAKGVKTNPLNENEIINIATKHGLKVKTDSLELEMFSITSKLDSWRVERGEYYYTLFHKDNNYSCIGNGEHVQDVFVDLEYLMNSIVEHDDYKMKFCKKEA